jgi:hypothetical protein
MRGDVVSVVRGRYGAVVHPYLEGRCGEFGERLQDAELSSVIDIVAALHAIPPSSVDLHQLVDLEAREMLPTTTTYSAILDRYDELAARLAARPTVITHGEYMPEIS